MIGNLYKFLFSAVFVCVLSLSVSAQFGRQSDDKDSDNDVTKNFQEQIVKQRIEREKKDYQELLSRGDEAVQISKQLENTYADKKQLSSEDFQKLDRLEKLLKKIRTELGADSDDDTDDLPVNPTSNDKPQNAYQRLQSMSLDLADKLKDTTRFSISVAAIQSSNALLRMVRFLKIKK